MNRTQRFLFTLLFILLVAAPLQAQPTAVEALDIILEYLETEEGITINLLSWTWQGGEWLAPNPNHPLNLTGINNCKSTATIGGKTLGMEFTLTDVSQEVYTVRTDFFGETVVLCDLTVRRPGDDGNSDGESSVIANERQLWAMYMGFWVGAPSWQTDLLSDRPEIGGYDSRDASVVQTQISQAQSAGIDAFMVTWFGPQSGEATAIVDTLLAQANSSFKIGVVVDAFTAEFNRTPAHLTETLRYAMENYVDHPAYVRYADKPVIMFAFQNSTGLSAAQWESIRAAVDPQRRTIWIAEGLSGTDGCCIYGGVMDGVYAFNMAWAEGTGAYWATQSDRMYAEGGDIYVATVHPGWDESRVALVQGRENPTATKDRDDGLFLRRSFNGATASGADILLVVSWNEYLENSHIEPSQRFGDTALNTLAELASSWKQ